MVFSVSNAPKTAAADQTVQTPAANADFDKLKPASAAPARTDVSNGSSPTFVARRQFSTFSHLQTRKLAVQTEADEVPGAGIARETGLVRQQSANSRSYRSVLGNPASTPEQISNANSLIVSSATAEAASRFTSPNLQSLWAKFDIKARQAAVTQIAASA